MVFLDEDVGELRAMLAAAGAAVTVLCASPLVGLLSQIEGITVARRIDGLPLHDLWIDQMSLPRLLPPPAGGFEPIPRAQGYLSANPDRIAAWRREIGLGVRIGLESLGSTLRIARDPDGDFDAEVEGSPVNLIALAGPSPEHLLRSGTVQVRGDTELLQRYRELGLLLRPDLEEELSRFVGDAPAHQVMRFAGSVFGFGRHAADTVGPSISQRITEPVATAAS